MRAVATRAALLLAAAVLSSCSPPRDPITLQEGILTIENRSSRDWRDVRVTDNDHFFGGSPLLPAGGRMNAHLSQLQTGFGQKFDRWRMSVRKVEVTATVEGGEAVRIEWRPGRIS